MDNDTEGSGMLNVNTHYGSNWFATTYRSYCARKTIAYTLIERIQPFLLITITLQVRPHYPCDTSCRSCEIQDGEQVGRVRGFQGVQHSYFGGRSLTDLSRAHTFSSRALTPYQRERLAARDAGAKLNLIAGWVQSKFELLSSACSLA